MNLQITVVIDPGRRALVHRKSSPRQQPDAIRQFQFAE